MQLHDYQKRAVDFCLTHKNVFLMMDLGLGKTATALNVIQKAGNPTLVIAPLRVCYSVWPQEIVKWTPYLTYTILHGKDKALRLRQPKNIYILNYDGLKWFYNEVRRMRFALPFNLILDESSFVKSAATQRFKMLKNLAPLWSEYKLCLSATPAPNGLHELWSQYMLLDGGKRLGRTFSSYRNQYFNYTGPPIYKTTLKTGADKHIYNKIKDITFRLDAKDYLDMPPITYNQFKLGMTPKIHKQYQELESEFFLEIGESEVEVFNAAALSSKLRQFIQGCMYTNENGDYAKVHNIKIDALKEIRESTSQPILCPIQFRFEYTQIEKQIKGVPIIYGGTKPAEAKILIDQWNRGNIPLLLCHPASLGYGVNLQTGGHIILWFGLTWSLEQYQQMIGRLWRQGQKEAVVVHHLVMDGTLDTTIMKVLRTKNATQKTLLDALKQRANRR